MPLQARAVGKLHVDDQVALVLFGDEALGHDLEAQAGHGQQPAINHQQHDGDTRSRPRTRTP